MRRGNAGIHAVIPTGIIHEYMCAAYMHTMASKQASWQAGRQVDRGEGDRDREREREREREGGTERERERERERETQGRTDMHSYIPTDGETNSSRQSRQTDRQAETETLTQPFAVYIHASVHAPGDKTHTHTQAQSHIDSRCIAATWLRPWVELEGLIGIPCHCLGEKRCRSSCWGGVGTPQGNHPTVWDPCGLSSGFRQSQAVMEVHFLPTKGTWRVCASNQPRSEVEWEIQMSCALWESVWKMGFQLKSLDVNCERVPDEFRGSLAAQAKYALYKAIFFNGLLVL